MTPSSKQQFLLNFLRNPLRNASVVPSSPAACRAVLQGIDFSQCKYVVELGPGTGCFTEQLYAQLPSDAQVLIVEVELSYIAHLQEQFGDRFEIVQGSAHLLDDLVAERGWPHIDLILSGLPFSLPASVKVPLFETLRQRISAGTELRFFTYMPPVMKRYYRGFPLRMVRRVLANLPPMWIYSAGGR